MREASGRYLLALGPHDPPVEEAFTCGPQGDGWCWRATRRDPVTGAGLGRLVLEVGAGGSVRLHAEHGGWTLRGGEVGGAVLWRRGDEEHETVADGFAGSSPGLAAATVSRLRGQGVAVGESRRLRLVEVTEPVLATRTVDTSWTRTAGDRWRVVDLATGTGRDLALQDGLVVAGTGLTLTRA